MNEATQTKLDEFLASQQETTRVRYAVQDLERLYKALRGTQYEMVALLSDEKIHPDLQAQSGELVGVLAVMSQHLEDDREYLVEREADDARLLMRLNATMTEEK